MLNEREHLKNLILQYLSDFNDILYLDKQDRESFKAHVTKNKEEQFFIFDKNYSIEMIFDKIYLNLHQNDQFMEDLNYDLEIDSLFDRNFFQFSNFYLFLQRFIQILFK